MKEPLWLSVARMSEGISEIPGALSNPVILRWARDIHAPAYDNDDIAWCAVWWNRNQLACQFPMAGSGWDLLRAKTAATYGQALSGAALGATGVFSRPEGYHVGYYIGERANDYRVLGGNTGNAVAPAWLSKSRLVAWRWPPGVALPTIAPVLLADDGYPASTNET